jgi:hypothetical protein
MRNCKPLYSPHAELLSTPAVTHPGWYGYQFGVSGDQRMVIDHGPNSLVGDSLMQAETIDAPDRWTPFALFAPRSNLPPQMFDGTAQRAHPNILGLVEFTPIGPGEVWQRDIRPTAPPQDQFDIATWVTGLGQIANNVALVYASGTNQGEGAPQGSGVQSLETILPSDWAVAYVTPDAPNAAGPTVEGASLPPQNAVDWETGANLVGPNPPNSGATYPIFTYFANLFGFTGNPGS